MLTLQLQKLDGYEPVDISCFLTASVVLFLGLHVIGELFYFLFLGPVLHKRISIPYAGD